MELIRSGRTVGADVDGVVRGERLEGTPVAPALRVLETPRTAWATPTTAVVAGGDVATLSSDENTPVGELRSTAKRLFDGLQIQDGLPEAARPRLFGGFSFTGGDPTTAKNGTWRGFASVQFVLPAVQVSTSAEGTWVTATALGTDADEIATARLGRWCDRIEALAEFVASEPPGIERRTYTPELPEWRERVASVVARIRRGDLDKVVLAQSLGLELATEADLVDVLARLGRSYPSCHRFLLEPTGGRAFIGATPERLVRLRGRTVETEALAGSIGRGETDAEDRWLERQLLESEKNNHEHSLVVDTICRQLEDCQRVETGDRTVRKLSNVQHLQTPIRATLAEDEHVLDLVERLHPTPAVGGLPPATARETIAALEGFDRGWYAAPVGWIDEHGDGTFVVAIRSAVFAGRRATLFAGAGIVSDSDPDEEHDELQLKFQPILDELDR